MVLPQDAALLSLARNCPHLVDEIVDWLSPSDKVRTSLLCGELQVRVLCTNHIYYVHPYLFMEMQGT